MLSIIILTFNSIEYIKACLDSVFVQDQGNFEVIVVDNGSLDGTVALVKRDYPQVKLYLNKENLGACKARNQGIESARGEWLLTLDCDVVLRNDFLTEISKAVKAFSEDTGIIQPKILNTDGKTIYSCGIYLSWFRRFYDIGKNSYDNGQYDKLTNIFGACCATAVYRRSMLEEIKERTGYFDERFFFLVEDVDLAWRAQRKGWRGLFIPKALCYHYGNSCDKKTRQYLCFRNRYHSIVKNEGIGNYCKKLFPLLLYDLPRSLYLFLTNPRINRDSRFLVKHYSQTF